MIKFVVLARGPKEWTRDQFVEWWRGPHAELAKNLPGLLQYKHGRVQVDYDHLNDEPAWDGLAELYFEDREALERMLQSKEWSEAVKDTASMGGRRIALIMDEVDLLAGQS